MKTGSRVFAALVVGAALSTSLCTGAQAAPKTTVVFTAKNYMPDDFAVSRGSLAFVVCAKVARVAADGSQQQLPVPGCTRVDPRPGVAFSTDGATFALAQTERSPGGGGTLNALSRIIVSDTLSGEVRTSTSVEPIERESNPDGGQTYGTTSKDPCVRGVLGSAASYQGGLGSSLSAVASGSGGWDVTDRDGNTVYYLDSSDRLSVLAVLPPVKVKVSAALAASRQWPSCMVGTTISYEAAPSDVEVAPDGTLYVAAEPALKTQEYAPQSVIFKIDPVSRKVTELAHRYTGRLDLAAGSHGRVFVAQLGEEKISVLKNGRSKTYAKLAKLTSIETDERGRLYAAQGQRSATEPPRIVRFG